MRPMKTKKENSKRADMTQISISLERDLVKHIDKLAKDVNRNRSNFIVHTLKELVKQDLKS